MNRYLVSVTREDDLFPLIYSVDAQSADAAFGLVAETHGAEGDINVLGTAAGVAELASDALSAKRADFTEGEP